MPKLQCGVSNCGNNAEGGCCRGEIQVAGGNTASDTCCNNFTEYGSASNSATGPNESLSVSCGAQDCVHNNSSFCNAESIDVSGFGATNSVETQCSSFCHR